MAKLSEWWRRIVFSFRRGKMDRELAEEMRQHLELKTRHNVATGMDEEEARYAAQRQLGNLTRMEEESRQSWGFPFLESLAQDVRYGLRGLRKSPGFTVVAIITLALGIGATTAIFSVVNTVLLRPLPYQDAQRIARIQTISPMFPEFQLGESIPDFEDIRSGARSFETVAAYQEKPVNLTGPGEPEQISAAAISAEFLPLLGVSPALGHGIQPDDEHEKNGKVALLSHRLWRDRFGSDPNVAGRTVALEQKPYTIIGVMPASFEFPRKRTDLWLPLIVTPEEAKRGNWFFHVLAKLRPEQRMQAAQTELDNLAARLSSQYPKDDAGIQFKLTPLQDQVTGNAKSGLMLLLGAVGFLLLIACANVSNLVLSRGVQRQNEIAIRAALGASRARISRQLLVESMLLACLGGAAGMLVAVYGVDAYRALAPADVPRLSELRVDPAIAWIALALSSLAGILCGLAPALHTSRPDLNLSLKERAASGQVVGRLFSLRGWLVVAEVALALVLLDGSALMVQSMVRMLSVDAGFRTDHMLTAELNLPKARYATVDARRIFVQQLLDTLHANDRLKDVAMSDSAALTDSLKMMTFEPGTLGAGDKSATLQMRSVAPGFFETLRIRLVSGRPFNETDGKGATRVAIINEAMGRRYFSGQNVLGKVLKFGPEPDDQCQIVGMVADTRDVTLRAEPRPQVYLPLLRNTEASLHLFVRTSADPLALAADLRKAVWAIDKDEPVSHVQSMTEVIAQSVAEPRFRTWLLGVFAAAGLTLTLVGIYGVVSYMAGQRTREIGIRVALGAQRGNVLRLVLGQGVRLAMAGAVAGVVGSLALTRLLKGQLFGIKPTDPATLIGAAVLMLLVALAACYAPARRATRVDPLVTLRHE
jgi:putative ABC transport system permease protein